MNDSVDTSSAIREENAAPPVSRFKWLNWSGLFLAFIQSVCSAFIAFHGVRLLVGIGAVVLASATWKVAERLHVDAIRIPMMLMAFLGAVINLGVLWQVRRLRNRSASAWRQQPLTPGKRRSEILQLALSVLTLVLLLTEVVAHYKLKGAL
jgi:heme/copper-type cytochrome/quinol oxidase subunit 2